jgi:hypothetical protein
MAVSGTRIFAGTAGGMYRSDDDGRHWTAINTGLPSQECMVNALLVKGSTLFAGIFSPGLGVYRSDDNGDTWYATGPNPGQVQAPNLQISSLAQRGNELWACSGTTIFRSTDDGLTWQAVTAGLDLTNPPLPVRSLAATAEDVYAVLARQGVYRLAADGNHWELVLADVDVYTVAAANGVAFAGNSNTVFRSANRGADWEPLDNLTNLSFNNHSVIARGTNCGRPGSTGFTNPLMQGSPGHPPR